MKKRFGFKKNINLFYNYSANMNHTYLLYIVY